MDNTVKAAFQIVELVAVDPPITVLTRFISSYQKVTSCRPEKDERLYTFVSRFRGLAAKHLVHSQVSSSSQIAEVLAITLLKYAVLEEIALKNANFQLIAHAETIANTK